MAKWINMISGPFWGQVPSMEKKLRSHQGQFGEKWNVYGNGWTSALDPAGFRWVSLFTFLLQISFLFWYKIHFLEHFFFFFFSTLTNSTCSWREVQVTVPPTLFCPHGSGRKWPKSRPDYLPHTFTHAYPTSPSCFFIKEFTFSLL